MKINKIFLVSVILLAIVTLGAVSASDNTLNTQDLSINENTDSPLSDSYDDEDIDDEDIDDEDWDDEDDEDIDDEDDEDEDEDEDDGDDEGDDGNDEWEEYAIDWYAEDGVYYLNLDEVIVSLQVPEDAKGQLQVDVDDAFFANFPLVKGYGEITLGDLKFQGLESHYLRIAYTGTDYYVEDLDEDIYLITYEFETPDSNSVFGKDVTYKLNLHNNVSGTLSFKDEVTYVDETTDEFYDDFEIVDGIAVVTLSDLLMGQHYFTFTFNDQGYDIVKYYEYWVYPPVTVNKKVVITQDSFFKLNLPEDACGEVMFTLIDEDGDEEEFDIYYEDGVFEIHSSALVPGHYEVSSFVIIDDEYGSFSWDDSPLFETEDVIGSFDAVYPKNTAISAKDAKVTYTQTLTYKIKVTVGSRAVEDVKVTFKIDGKVVKTTTTDEDGYATLKISKKPGTYKITVVSLGKTVTKKLTVNHVIKLTKVSKIKKTAKKLTLTATLSKINGKYLTNKKIAFKFKGVTYYKYTNSKGVATLTISKAIIKKLGKTVSYQATYSGDTIKYTAKVVNK